LSSTFQNESKRGTISPVLELLLLVVLLTGLMRAGHAGHAWALLGGAAALYLLLADTLSVAAVDSTARPLFAAFNHVVIGPGTSAFRAPGALPLPALLLSHPLWLRGLRSLLSGAVASRCLHESSKLNPLVPRSYELDGIAMPFFGAGFIDAAEGVVLFLVLELMG
jgi:hypothetical protein